MSKERSIKIMTAVAFGLALLLVAGLGWQNLRRPSQAEAPLLADLPGVEKLLSLEISGAGEALKLAKQDGRWWLERDGDRWPVQQSRLKDYLDSLRGLKSTRRVAQDSKNDQALGLAAGALRSVTLTMESAAPRQLDFGALSEDGTEQYLRLPPQSAVLAVAPGSAFWLEQKRGYWLDRQAWPSAVRSADIVGIEIVGRSGTKISLSRQDGPSGRTWQAQGPGSARVEQERLSSWVTNTLGWEADELVALPQSAAPAGYGLELSITLAGADKQSWQLAVYRPADQSAAWIVVPRYPGAPSTQSGQGLGFLLPEWKLQRGVLGL